MYRNVILEFLTTKHLDLAKAEYYQMTICSLGHNYGDNLIKLVKSEEEISVYHIKEPRIYEKRISFDDLANNLLMMVFELKTEIKFKKSELNFELKDPFYLKDLNNQDFNSLLVTPIIENENVIGAVITYFKSDNGYIKFTNNELIKLLKNLDEDEVKEYEARVYDKLTSKTDFLLIARVGKQTYLNEFARKQLKVKNSIVYQSDLRLEKMIQKLINEIGFNKLVYDTITIYYIECDKFKPINESEIEVLALQNLNSHHFENHFSYIFVRKSLFSNTDAIIKDLQSLKVKLDITNYKLYEFNDETFIMLLDQVITSKLEEQIKEFLKDNYIIVLTTNKEITNKMNLIELSKYLYDVQPEEYVKANYIAWLNKKNMEKLSYDDKFKENKLSYEIVSSLDNHILVEMSMLPLRLEYRDSHFISYDKVVEKSLISAAKMQEEKIMITISTSLLSKRKTYEDVKKILLNNNLWINVIVRDGEEPNEFLKLISKYKKLNLMMSCDSSVYLNYYYMNALPLFDGLYIQNNEYEQIRNQEVGLPQVIFDYAIKQYKHLIFENFNPNQDSDYVHFNCYYVKPKK